MLRNPVLILTIMQIKDKFELSFLQDKKKTLFKSIYGIIGLLLMTLLLYAVFSVISFLNIFSLSGMIPVSFITVVFSIMITISLFSNTFGLTKSLYFSKDNFALLSMPVNTNQIFLSKLIVYLLYELKRNFSFIVPFFWAYGIMSGFSIIYYPWVLISFILISMLTVGVSSFLSIPAMLTSKFLKNRVYIQVVAVLSIMAAGFWAVIKIISSIPTNVNFISQWGTVFWQMQGLLSTFVERFKIFYRAVRMIVGEVNIFGANVGHHLFVADTFIMFFAILITTAIFITASFIIVKPLFLKVATSFSEHSSRQQKTNRSNKIKNRSFSMIWKEVLTTARSPEALIGIFSLFAVLPISIFLLNQLYAAMNTRLLGDYLIMAFNILILLLILLGSNSRVASIYSKEGKSSYLIKTKPVSYQMSLVSKLIINIAVTTLSLTLTIYLFYTVNDVPISQSVLFFVLAWTFYIGHLAWSAELDVMNPQNEEYERTGGNFGNPNEAKSIVGAYIIAILLFVIALFLFMEGVVVAWIKIALIGVIFMIFRTYLFISKIKVYYKEL